MLLYTYFYNISLNALKTNIYQYVIYLFRTFQLSEELGPKLGQRLTTFHTLWARAPTELQRSIIFFHWHAANQETNKTMPAIFFFSNISRIIYFLLFSCKMRFRSSSTYCNKKLITHCQKIREHGFVQQSFRDVCVKFKVDHFGRFRTGAHQVSVT